MDKILEYSKAISDELLLVEDTQSQVEDNIEKARAVLAALGETLFDDEDANMENYRMRFNHCKLLYFVCREHIQNALDLMALDEEE